MINPRYARIAERLKQLIDEGKSLPISGGDRRYVRDQVRFAAWHVNVRNIIQSSFGKDSVYSKSLANHPTTAEYSIQSTIGVLSGALNDLEGGYWTTHESLVAGAIFDSVLEQSKHLLEAGYKDPAAILCRVVLEDCLRRICRNLALSDTKKAAELNNSLREAGRYNQPQWRSVQVWLDIGNAAAHGKFQEYDAAQVKTLISDVASFAARELGP